MRAPSFWWREAGLAAGLLSPLSALYGAITAARLKQSGARVSCPVICVGNPTLGGAGKTPTAIAIARSLMAYGAKPFFLTRGYGGRLLGPIRVEPSHTALDVGDEPLLLARVAPTIVSAERVAGARLAVDRGAGVIVMDDGFQNPSLTKDLSILAVDGRRGVGNGLVFPAGPLRAPLDVQLARAQALLVIGTADGAKSVVAAAANRGLPVFHGRLEPDAATVAALKGTRVLAFAGIGDPEKFFATLETAGTIVAAKRAFPDHHPYSDQDAAELLAHAKSGELKLVTTEKDMARLSGQPALASLAASAGVLPVNLRVDESERWSALFRGLLTAEYRVR